MLIFLRRRPGYRPPGYRYRVAGHQATSHQLRGTGRQVSRHNVQGRSPKTTVTKTKIESPVAARWPSAVHAVVQQAQQLCAFACC